MKLLWLSNAPWSFSGYGNQTKIFLKKFVEAGHDVACAAYYGHKGAPLMSDGYTVVSTGFDQWGRDGVMAHMKMLEADYLFSLMDVWVLDGQMWQDADIKWCPWFPIDAHPIPLQVLNQLEYAHLPITMSEHGNQMMLDAQYKAEEFAYVPHGIDTETFQPHDMAEARKAMHLPADDFIIGMVAANVGFPSRKAFTPQIEAFKILKQKHQDARLYIHTNATGQGTNGVNLKEFAAFIGLAEDDVIFPNQAQYNLNGYTEHQLSLLYSSFNVHSLVSMGEGFGIPTIEAQACGCPVIVGDWSASPELVFSGRKVSKASAEPYYLPIGAYQYKPQIQAIADAYLKEYNHHSSREKARAGAMAYDADVVMEKYWQPVLARLEDEL